MSNAKRLNQLDFTVPGIKPIGLELIKLVNAPEPDLIEIARTAELDPAIFGTIIACANSVMYGGIKEIGDLRMAVTRLGLREVRRIIFHVVLESAFRADHAEINLLLRDLWTQSLSTALIMQRLIPDWPQIRDLPVDMVAAIYPLGLLHLIGVPVLIANYAPAFSSFARDDLKRTPSEILAQEHARFDGFDHLQLGAELVRRWGFPDQFAEVLAIHHLPRPALSGQDRLLHSLLRQARYLGEAMGYAAMPNTPEDYWLEGNILDVSLVDTAAVERDVLEQMDQTLAFTRERSARR